MVCPIRTLTNEYLYDLAKQDILFEVKQDEILAALEPGGRFDPRNCDLIISAIQQDALEKDLKIEFVGDDIKISVKKKLVYDYAFAEAKFAIEKELDDLQYRDL